MSPSPPIRNPPLAAAIQQGLALHKAGKLEEAEVAFRAVLKTAPTNIHALTLLGTINAQRGNPQEALRLLELSLGIDPRQVYALNGKGNVLLDMDRPREALAAFDAAIALKADYADAYTNRGNALLQLKRHAEALASYDKAIALKKGGAESYFNRGNALLELGQSARAVASYDQSIALKEDFAAAHVNRGLALKKLKRYDEALASFERAARLDPNFKYLAGYRLNAKMQLCDWSGFAEGCAAIIAAIESGQRASMPFDILAIPAGPEVQLRCATIYVANEWPADAEPLWRGDTYSHERIRLAYLSADFHEHPTAYLMEELFALHDRARFDVTGISFGPEEDSDLRRRLTRSFDRFIDVRNASDQEIAQTIRNLEIDIAVDLSGFSAGCRPGVWAKRPAPLQVNYLVYPGTRGTDTIDYILADRIVIPPDRRGAFSEQVVYLPNSYQLNSQRPRAQSTPARGALGLPEKGFVFCSFNGGYKITPDAFDIWMRLLQAVPDSVFWLLEENPAAIANLRREAEKRGVKPEKLVFAPRLKRDQHLARQGAADLFLDTLYCGAHTTASDALWAGLPVLTHLGPCFAGRVASSLLTSVGLPELIARSPEDYEATALKLAREPGLLADIRARLARNRDTGPLFDTRLSVRHLEAAYAAMWEKFRQGSAPAAFSVEPAG
ncbi:MAG TPA: tetratricopeptide repeat protein [Stellaceae bacterium]|nr:tetratricopeptide repeat protein [Stellaceae bacterium]